MYFADLLAILPSFPGRPHAQPPQVASRREFLAGVLAGVLAGIAWQTGSHPADAAEAAATTYPLTVDAKAGRFRSVVLKVDTKGELKLNADGQKVTRKPIEVRAEFAYEEALAPADVQAGTPTVLRHYERAQAEITLNGKPFTTKLADDHTVIAYHEQNDQRVCYSPAGPLTRDELELLEVPGHSAFLDALLPSVPDKKAKQPQVAVGAEWPIDATSLARLLNLDAVTEAKVQGKLAKVDGNVAVLHLTGTVEGAVGGIATEIELTGKLNLDLQKHLITWLAMGIKESRAIGHAEPGFETTTQVRVAIQALDQPRKLAKDQLAGMPLEYEVGQSLLQFESKAGGYRTLLDRRWHLMIDRPDLTVLRWIDRGDLIAQCNISRLPALAAGKQLSLEEFQDDIKQSLTKTFQQFVEASQSVSPDGLRTLRVVAAGEASDLPVQWNYYHISNEAGQRVALVFTLEANLAERFAENDRPMVGALTILDSPQPIAAEPIATEVEAKVPAGK